MKYWLYKFGLNILPVSLLRIHLKTCTHNIPQQTQQKQLLIDVSAIAHNDAKTGIQRVVRNLYHQILLSPPDGYKVCPVMATRKRFYRQIPTNFMQQENFGLFMQPIQIQAGDIFLGLDLSAHLIPHHLPEMWEWKTKGVRMTFVVYDILPVLHPEWFNPKATNNFHKWLRALAWLADSVIGISRSAQTDFINWLQRYGVNESDITYDIIPLGAELDALTSKEEIRNLNNPTNSVTFPYILMVGTLEPRKGYDDALSAFEALWATGDSTRLIIVGKQGWKIKALIHRINIHSELNKRLIWLENVDDTQLRTLYQDCLGMLLTSKGEGFGLPLLEATYFNKPALVRDLPVFREMGGVGVSYFANIGPNQLNLILPRWLTEIKKIRGKRHNTAQVTWTESCVKLVSTFHAYT